ncbi:IclR family transcriptional regulator [Variovorax paradoxus]|nr:IclR family transcriptional regulator [Variovorax paradoxus]
MPASADTCSILTVDRGLQVLRAFHSAPIPLTNARLVQRTGLSKATVSRLTTTLLNIGYLRRGADGREFELASRALMVGFAFASTSELLETINPLLQALADEIGGAACLTVPDDKEMLCVASRASVRIKTIRFGRGCVVPMAATAAGRAYLWDLPAAERDTALATLRLTASPDKWAFVESEIHESFQQLERGGTCIVRGGFSPGLYAVATPVKLGLGRFCGVVSCGKTSSREPDLELEHKRLAGPLRSAAAQIQSLLSGLHGRP